MHTAAISGEGGRHPLGRIPTQPQPRYRTGNGAAMARIPRVRALRGVRFTTVPEYTLPRFVLVGDGKLKLLRVLGAKPKVLCSQFAPSC